LGNIRGYNARRVLELLHIQMKITTFEREILLRNRSLFQIAVPLVSCLHKGIFGRIELSHLKEEALDRTIWRNRFGRGVGPVVGQNTE
jgi:hypothetical protein